MKLRRAVLPGIIAMASVAATVLGAYAAVHLARVGFPHEKHAALFPLCATCHAGVAEPEQPMWPEPARCASCHDDVVKPRVEWQPRVGPRPGNRRFTHEAHDRATTAKNPADSAQIRNCSACHNEAGAPRMIVRNAVVGRCLDCHGLEAPHVDVPSKACATCHVRLTDAPGLTRDEIRRFPRPRSHRARDFLFGGHGKAAKVPGIHSGPLAIAASCATCHARNLCIACHVNPPLSPVILALSLDDRSPVSASAGRVPVGRATDDSARVQLARAAPSSHTWEFRERHRAEANARPRACETCHVRSMCLECHRPDGARQSRYHAQGFLTRHPSSAYARDANCADCHNRAQFCQSCHRQTGLVAAARIGPSGYHDAFRGFSLGHGQAARQSLESCASCHAERDCTACHSAVGGGFRFNPHGPGFNATRLRSKNPSLCVACHGRAIPDGR